MYSAWGPSIRDAYTLVGLRRRFLLLRACVGGEIYHVCGRGVGVFVVEGGAEAYMGRGMVLLCTKCYFISWVSCGGM